MKKSILFLFVFTASFAFAQIEKNNKSSLTIEKIMQDPNKWMGTLPEQIKWDVNSNKIYFQWNPEKDTLSSIYHYTLRSGKIEKTNLSEKEKLPGSDAKYSSDRTKMVYTRNGNIYLLNLKNGNEIQLTDWLKRASSPRFVMNDSRISFMFDNELFTIDIETRAIQQITNFINGQKRPDEKNPDEKSWLENQQMELFKVLNDREKLQKAKENQRKKEEIKQPEKIYLGNARLRSASLSPTGKYVVYSMIERQPDSKNTEVTQFVTESGYTEQQSARAKVANELSTYKMGIFDAENNQLITVKTNMIPGLKDLPDYFSDYPEKIPSDTSKIKSREINLLGPVWNSEKDLALLVALSHDNKDRWILLLDPKTGDLKTLDRQRDEAWIAGSGIEEWGTSTGEIGWMPDNKSVWFHSEEGGYSHIYTVNIETGEKNALTNGQFEVSNAFISKDKKHFYFTANKVHPGVMHFYKMPVWGGELTQITSMEGNNEVTLSPDEKQLAIRYSFANKPWELYIQKNEPGAKAEQITYSTTEEFNSYPWRVPEFITFNAADGVEIHARLYRPENPEKQGPAVIFVHGAGYLHNAHKWWSEYFREYQFHNFLADNGYTVLDIDYRGSAGYGRDFRTGIYRHMGGKDLSDQVDGAKYLMNNYDVSPERIGIYGGSYGGFITLMAMFNHPDVFTAGAALRSVTDWAHYNHEYTSNILNTPTEDSIAFVRSSPIYFAEGLQGALLMCHGMVDDNVQFQDIVRLTQRYIELGKENWELAVYPVERHSFTEPSSWMDEYKRIYKLFEENLK